jgi:hypothetical protein
MFFEQLIQEDRSFVTDSSLSDLSARTHAALCFATMSRLSTRVSIKWGTEAASEPTDTLVMSVGEYYMDLRVNKSDTSIDWAMAGQRLIKSEDPSESSISISITLPQD